MQRKIFKLHGRDRADEMGDLMGRYRLIFLFFSIAFFFLGILIYAFLRDINSMILFQYIPKMPWLSRLHIPIKAESLWSKILLYNLSDGFWCLSALLFVRAIWLHNIWWCTAYSLIFIIIALSFEFSQLSEKIPGTFDIMDLVSICFFALLEYFIFYKIIKRKLV